MDTTNNHTVKIAVLGSTGHIAKNLIYRLSKIGCYDLFLFARNIDKVNNFINMNISSKERITVKQFNQFFDEKYDVIINCIGIGNPAKLREIGEAIFRLTEEYDNTIIEYLDKENDALYINFSSGAAYGSDFSSPADQNKSAIISVNNISPADYYTISKINTEVKHRAFSYYNIVDLRVFGFFSRFIDLKTPFFLSDLVNCVMGDKVFITSNNDMIRDYIHPLDLFQLVEKCIQTHYLNDVFDVYSLEPISKFQLIDYFTKQYNLRVSIENEMIVSSVTGIKSNYYSLNKKSNVIGYSPLYRSLDSIDTELNVLLKNKL